MYLLKAFKQIPLESQGGLIAAFVAALLFWSSIASQLPAMPLYVRSLGGTPSQVGTVMGSFAIGLLLSRSYLGRFADRHGRRKVMQLGLVVAAFVPLLYAAFPSIPLLMVFRAIHGISIAAFATGYSALIADLAPQQQRGEIIGYMSLVNPLGLAFGPALGGWIHEVWGYKHLFFVASGLAIAGFVSTRRIREPEGFGQGLGNRATKNLWQTLLSKRMCVPTLILFLIGLVFGTLSAFLPLLIEHQRISLNVGLFYTTAAIAGFVVRLPIASISDRFGRGLFISVGLSFYALSMAVIAFSHSEISFLIAAMFEGIGSGITIPAIVSLLADRTASIERGFVFGLAWAGFDLGMALAGPIVGNAIPFIGLTKAFEIATVLALLGLIVLSTQSNHNPAASLRFALGRAKDAYAIRSS